MLIRRFTVPLFSLFLLSLVIGTIAGPAQAAVDLTSGADPIVLAFEKSDPEGDYVWNGTVDGDMSGNLETVLLAYRPSDRILHVTFDWIISADAKSFTARLSGVLDTETGRVVMDGTIVEGWLLGAQVHEEGRLIDPGQSGFAGIIRVMPASAD